MSALVIAMTAAWSAAATLLAVYALSVAGDVTYVTLADGRRQERSLPILFKMLLPFAGNFRALLSKPRLAKRMAITESKLISAGFEGVLSAEEFTALEFLVPIALSPIWCGFILILQGAVPDSVLPSLSPALCLLGIALLVLQPRSWLSATLKKRHFAIMRALPFVLDILTLSVEAGMDFISALQRNFSSRKLDPLNEELLRMTKEIQLGLSRREALRKMADRVKQSDLASVAFALIQADELGVSIGAILRIQSDQLRARRFDRAERLAAQAPTKMLMPLMLCIFPAVFIILLGPVLSQALKGIF